jgi:glutamine amidotransferase
MKVGIVDYGMGNLASVSRALAKLGVESFIAANPGELALADRTVLPGVGSFADGMARLVEHGWVQALREDVARGKPLLGICLGMQLLASSGSEWGRHAGLDLVPGEVTRLDEMGCQLRVPHVGWNDLHMDGHGGELFEAIPDGSDFYFVHSFAFQAQAREDVLAWVDYGIHFAAAVRRGHVFGVQFHPEKSSRAGSRVLRNFIDYRPC